MENYSLFKLILSDYRRHEIPKNQALQFIYFFILLLSQGFRAVVIYRISRHFRNTPIINKLILLIRVLIVRIEIYEGAQIGYGLVVAHPQSVVIGKSVIMGNNITIESDVTIGKNFDLASPGGGYPCIGDNVMIGAGAKIIGKITIGDNCLIGANAVVIKDVPANSVAAGIPARVIRSITKTKETT
jgi:serine O-acetyltransferase